MADAKVDQTGLFGDVLSQLTGPQATSIITSESGGGAVSVRLRGLEAVESVTIAPGAVDDVPLLEELVIAAMNDALGQARAAKQKVALDLLAQLGQGGTPGS